MARKKLRSDGYDGIIFNNGEEIIAFSPEQIKSATGNSGAFDAGNPDMRFSTTRVKQTETPEFKRWFGNSKVVDENGKPLVVYHGSRRKGIAEFHSQSWFTTREGMRRVVLGA